jgi:hypothetical protein
MISAFLDPVSAKIRGISGGQNHSQRPFSRGFHHFEGGYTPLFLISAKQPGNPVVFVILTDVIHHRGAVSPEISSTPLWWIHTIAPL